jgi:hypothetical protein
LTAFSKSENPRLTLGSAAQEATIESNETQLDAMKAEGQSLQEIVSFVKQQALNPFAHVLQIDRLQRQLQLAAQHTQNIQDELDEVKTKSLAEGATTLVKLKESFNDAQNLKDEHKNLSRVIRDMEIERDATNKDRQELARRSETLGRDLEKAEQRCREVVAHKERLEDENYSMLQQVMASSISIWPSSYNPAVAWIPQSGFRVVIKIVPRPPTGP